MAGPIPGEPVVVADEPVATEPAALTSPLADKIREHFSDPALAAQVDTFWREQSQPYVTGLEQQVATLKEADEFVQAMQNAPGQAWYDLTSDLLGEEVTAKLVGVIQGSDEPATPTPTATPEVPAVSAEPTPTSVAGLSAEDAALLAEVREERNLTAYQTALKDYASDKEDLQPFVNIFSPFVSAAGGDLDTAYEGFKQWKGQVEQLGLLPAAAAVAAEPAPVVLDGSTVTPGAAETPKKLSLSEAIAETAAAMRPAAPPTVGSV